MSDQTKVYHYQTNFDMDCYRSSVDDTKHTFGTDICNYGKKNWLRYVPIRKVAYKIEKETSKGYMLKGYGVLLKSDLDKLKITNYAGSRVNCTLEYSSFRDDLTLEDIKKEFIKVLLEALIKN